MDMVEGMLKGAKEPAWLEQPVVGELRAWQIIFLTIAAFTAIVIALCCCIRFRVPRTKQQIEADYQRRIITKKFRQQLEKIQNSQMDTIDLKTALELIRTEFKPKDENEIDQQNASLINSAASAGQSSEENSVKLSPNEENDRATEKTNAINTTGNLGGKLMALVRLSKQKEDKKINFEC